MKPKTVSELFPSKWLKADDLNGRSFNLTIKRCTVEEIYNTIKHEDEDKAILDFGKSKRLILNKTQCLSMQEITGTEEFKQWAGVTIELSPAKARSGQDTIAINKPRAAPAPAIVKNSEASEENENLTETGFIEA